MLTQDRICRGFSILKLCFRETTLNLLRLPFFVIFNICLTFVQPNRTNVCFFYETNSQISNRFERGLFVIVRSLKQYSKFFFRDIFFYRFNMC